MAVEREHEGGEGVVGEERMALTRSEQASKKERMGDGHVLMWRFSMGVDEARQASDVRRK